MSLDRLSAAWRALLNAFLGRKAAKTIDACAMYWGVVVKVSGVKIDVKLDTPDIASPTDVPLYLGMIGAVVLSGGERVLVGFRNGDPTQPYAIAFEQASGAQFVALANLVLTELQKIQTAHNSHVHVLTLTAGTGTAAPPVIAYTPAAVAATKTKAA